MTKPSTKNTILSVFRHRLADIRGLCSELDGVLSDGAGFVPALVLAQSLTSVDRLASDLANVAERVANAA